MATAARALRLLGASLHRRPTAAAAFTSAAAASRCSGSAVLRSATGGRLAQSVQRLGALHGAAVVCSAAGADGLVEVQLKVEGMVCEGCSSRVQEVLEKMAGVKKAHVDLEKGLATVSVDAGAQDAAAAAATLAKAVQELGFDAAPQA